MVFNKQREQRIRNNFFLFFRKFEWSTYAILCDRFTVPQVGKRVEPVLIFATEAPYKNLSLYDEAIKKQRQEKVLFVLFNFKQNLHNKLVVRKVIYLWIFLITEWLGDFEGKPVS